MYSLKCNIAVPTKPNINCNTVSAAYTSIPNIVVNRFLNSYITRIATVISNAVTIFFIAAASLNILCKLCKLCNFFATY